MSNVLCNIRGGGVFSKMSLFFQNIEKKFKDLDKIDMIYLHNMDDRINPDINPFNFIYKQEKPDSFSRTIECFNNCVGPSPLHFLSQPKLKRMKLINSKLKVRDDLLYKIQIEADKLGVCKECLGLHMRLTDMNDTHPCYGVFNFEDFVQRIKPYKDKKIFVASDNLESIIKLKDLGYNIVYYEDCLRVKTETGDIIHLILDNFSNFKLWEDVFIEMALLSLCGVFVHRFSSLAHMAEIYSNNINNTILLVEKENISG